MIKKSRTRLTLKHGLQASTLAILMFSSQAFAEPAKEYTFQPAAAWDVDAQTQVIADANVQSCSVSTEFNNGFIVKFDGSHKWVQSLQIDLRQAALDRGKSYDVNLNVPGQADVSAKGIADSANVLNINLNGQKKLYNAIRDNAVLDLGIEGNQFRFFMVGFGTASKDFERCMAGGDLKGEGPLTASASSDPFATITSNEAIAFEEAETKNIDVEDTAPTELKNIIEPTEEATLIPAEPEEPIVSNTRTIAENANDLRPKSEKRFSESLAEQIEENPDLVSLDEQTQETAAEAKAEIKPTEKVKEVETQEVANDDEEEQLEPAKALAAEAPTPKAIPEKASKKSKGKSLVIPSIIDDIELDSRKDITEEETESTAQTDQGEETITADDLNRMQLARLQGKPVAKAMPKTKDIADESMQKDSFEELESSSDEPFSKPLEKVTKRSSNKDIDIEVEEQSASTDTITPLPEKEVAVVETKRMVTPEFKTTTKTQHVKADFTKTEPAAGYTNDPDIGRKISQLERMIQELQAENTALEDELQVSLKDTEQERMAIASDNWNLERATMRFNEAERQLKSIGQQLQRERTQCQLEKQELEAMLFDPQITDEQQLARLASLERKLQAAEAKIRQYESETN